MYVVLHLRERAPVKTRWLDEAEFRYFRNRQAHLLQTNVLLAVHDHTDLFARTRVERWRSKADYEAFYDDPCIRVIDSVIRHQESVEGVVHRTIAQEIDG